MSKVFVFNNTTGGYSNDRVNIFPSYKPSGTMPAFTKNLYDSLLFVPICTTHQKVLLRSYGEQKQFLPYYPFKISDPWSEQIAFYRKTFFNEYNASMDVNKVRSNIMQVNIVRMPKYADQIHQLVVMVYFDQCVAHCSSQVTSFKWFTKEQLTSADLIGPEPYLYLNQSSCAARCQELSIEREVKQQAKKWKMLLEMNCNEYDIRNLFNEFVQHCFPSLYMNQSAFVSYLTKSKINIEVRSTGYTTNRLFSAFCVNNGTYVTFQDFVFGLIALDETCSHGGLMGEYRACCIFRYYTTKPNTSMKLTELTQLFSDATSFRKVKAQATEDTEVAKKSAEAIFKLENLKPDQTLSIERFILLVGQLQIRGTACLFRSIQSTLNEIRLKKGYGNLILREANLDKLISKKGVPFTAPKLYKCSKCNPESYNPAIHSSVLNSNDSTAKTKLQELPSSFTIKYPETLRKISIELFSSTNVHLELIQIIKSFSNTICGFPPVQKSQMNWEKKSDRMILMDKIFKLCLESCEQFKKLPRVMKCTSPIYVFGDIHGNLKDLMIYDHHLWRMAPSQGYVCGALFLGDYVDRGDYSIECVIYLLCMRALRPDKFTLIRGNHEVRAIQQQFTFYRECLDKFGDTGGNQLWEAFNQVFDVMPICAIVDEQV